MTLMNRRDSAYAFGREIFLGAASLFVMLFGLAVASTRPAEAHHPRTSADKTSGISIPNLAHGQLNIISRYQSQILSLANRQVRPSVEAHTLHNYVNLQLAYCLWGFMPGSIADEASPFNECSHAYLAASKVLLQQLQQADETRARANELIDQINFAMLEDVTALEICSNSFEPFNTAQIIMPMWGGTTFNPLGVVLGFFVFGASAAGLAMARGRRRTVQGAR